MRAATALVSLLSLALASCVTDLAAGAYADDAALERGLAEEPLLDPDELLVPAFERPAFALPVRLAIAPPVADETRGLFRSKRFIDAWTKAERRAIDAWAGKLRARGVLAEHVHLPSLLVDADSEQHASSLVARMRRAAAGLGCDALLVVRTASRASSRTNPLGILDLTVVGGLVLPGHDVRGSAIAEGLVLEVASGAPFLVERCEASEEERTAAFFQHERAEDLLERARRKAVRELVESLAGAATLVSGELARPRPARAAAHRSPAEAAEAVGPAASQDCVAVLRDGLP